MDPFGEYGMDLAVQAGTCCLNVCYHVGLRGNDPKTLGSGERVGFQFGSLLVLTNLAKGPA